MLAIAFITNSWYYYFYYCLTILEWVNKTLMSIYNEWGTSFSSQLKLVFVVCVYSFCITYFADINIKWFCCQCVSIFFLNNKNFSRRMTCTNFDNLFILYDVASLISLKTPWKSAKMPHDNKRDRKLSLVSWFWLKIVFVYVFLRTFDRFLCTKKIPILLL